MVEEQAMAELRQQQRDGDVGGARAVIDMTIPQAARGAEPVEGQAALAEAVEMLFAGQRQPQPQPRLQLDRIEGEAQARPARPIA